MIGIFDSGSGGLTVAQALRRRAPRIDLVYFGDILHAPYGDRDQDELLSLTIKGLSFLREHGAHHIVSACNSVSTAVIRPMAQLLGSNNSTIVEMVGPASNAAALLGNHRWVGVATPATVESRMYQDAFEALGTSIHMIACESLAGAIEFGEPQEVIERKVRCAVDEIVSKNADRVLLGCTHYPFVREVFERQLTESGSHAEIFDPADAVACETITRFGPGGSRITKVYTSKDTESFRKKVEQVFGTLGVEYYVI